MAITINGDGSITGLSVGGLPDGTVDSDTLASGIDKTSISDSGDATAITIDSNENVGIGVTPKTWDSRKALQIGGNGALAGSASAGAGGYLQLLQNAYTDGAWKYISTDEAARLRSQDGQWNFDVAASGSADSGISWTNAMNIDNSGHVTMPRQPCVSARATYTDIPINTVTVINLDNERFDVGNNLASNTFTAPITGKYLYTYTLYFNNVDTAATALGVQVVTSNRQYENWFAPDHIANTDFYYTATSSQIADMDANDTLQFKAYVGGGSTQTDVHADSQISIILIA